MHTDKDYSALLVKSEEENRITPMRLLLMGLREGVFIEEIYDYFPI